MEELLIGFESAYTLIGVYLIAVSLLFLVVLFLFVILLIVKIVRGILGYRY